MIKYEIEQHIVSLDDEDKDGYRTELNLVSWFGRKPKYDIRKWSADHERSKKGTNTFNREEMLTIAEAVLAHIEKTEGQAHAESTRSKQNENVSM